MGSTLRQGKLVKWEDERGFGFIRSADGEEIFIHISELKNSTRRPQTGDLICYRTTVDEDGKPRACQAFIAGARKRAQHPKRSIPKSSSSLESRPFPLRSLLLLSVLPLVGSIYLAWVEQNFIPLLLYPSMGVLTFYLYAHDKTCAQRGKWRVSEQSLHLLELAGGWLGGFAAQQRFRHKTRKRSYQLVFRTIVAMHLVGWLYWLMAAVLGFGV